MAMRLRLERLDLPLVRRIKARRLVAARRTTSSGVHVVE